MTESLADLRSRKYGGELSTPEGMDRLIGYARAEVGSQGPQAVQAFIETAMNRGLARAKSMAGVLSGSYFPGVTHRNAARPVTEAERAQYAPVVQSVLGGSNITNYATGNASGRVGFAGGPQTASYGGERFGVEGPDKGWWQRVGAEAPSGAGVGYTAPARAPGAPAEPITLASLRAEAKGPQLGSGPLWNITTF